MAKANAKSITPIPSEKSTAVLITLYEAYRTAAMALTNGCNLPRAHEFDLLDAEIDRFDTLAEKAADELRRTTPSERVNLELRTQILADNVFRSGGPIIGECIALLASEIQADNASSRKLS